MASTQMLAAPVSCYDIRNVETFVEAALRSAGFGGSGRGGPFTHDERDELLAEGICVLFELARRYDGTTGCFSGYAARYLPRRLTSAWHARHPHHYRLQRKGHPQHNKWLKGPETISFEGYQEQCLEYDVGDWEQGIVTEQYWVPHGSIIFAATGPAAATANGASANAQDRDSQRSGNDPGRDHAPNGRNRGRGTNGTASA